MGAGRNEHTCVTQLRLVGRFAVPPSMLQVSFRLCLETLDESCGFFALLLPQFEMYNDGGSIQRWYVDNTMRMVIWQGLRFAKGLRTEELGACSR